jgi:hypothetical protein
MNQQQQNIYREETENEYCTSGNYAHTNDADR